MHPKTFTYRTCEESGRVDERDNEKVRFQSILMVNTLNKYYRPTVNCEWLQNQVRGYILNKLSP